MEDFFKKGYVVKRGLLAPSELEPVKAVIGREVDRRAKELHAQGKIERTFENLPMETRWNEICKQHPQREMGWNREVFSHEIYQMCVSPKLLDRIEEILGPEIRVNGDYWVRPKLPNEKLTTLPWHQDGFYYEGADSGSESYIIVSVWIPLVDVDEHNGCLQIIPGSHEWGLIPSRRTEQGHLEPVEDVERRGAVETLRMRVGDVLFFDQLTLHRSLPNLSNTIRWSVDLRYSPADQPFTWHIDPDFDKRYPGMIARSPSDPRRVMGWADWHAKHLRRI